MNATKTLPDFATIRRIRDRQVLITRGNETDEESGDDRETLTIAFDLHAGARASLTMGFDEEGTRDEAWDRGLAGELDAEIGKQIDGQEEQWGGMIVPRD